MTRGSYPRLSIAVACFDKQSHKDRELVVVHQGLDAPSEQLLQSRPDTILVEAPADLLLGVLRNLSLSYATGEYVCQWDDDDWYDSERLRIQLAELQRLNVDGVLLRQWLLWDKETDSYYKSFDRPRYGWEGSLLCRTEAARAIRYPAVSHSEDTHFMARFQTKFKLAGLKNLEYLYLYIYHGNNTFSRNHFKMIFARSERLDAEISGKEAHWKK